MTMKKRVAVLSLMFTAACALQAGPEGVPGKQAARSLDRQFQRTLKLDYLLYLPEAYEAGDAKEWPLILFLHGAGERGDDIEKVALHGTPKIVGGRRNFPFIVASPQCGDGEVWDPVAVLGLLDALVEDYQVDTSRVYLTGLSMGGFGTWETGIAAPERFAALVPICGGGQPIDVVLAGGSRKVRLKEIPVWAFHGGKDTVVAPERSREMVGVLRAIGNENVKLTIYEEAGHDSWTEAYNDPALYEWLLGQQLER